MNGKNRSSFLPTLFNLPKHHLDRQISLAQRRQLIYHDNIGQQNQLIPLSSLITYDDDLIPLIRERLNYINGKKTYLNIHRDELAIKQTLLNSALLEHGTIHDLDKLIIEYYTSIKQQETNTCSTSSTHSLKLPMLKHSSLIDKSNSKSSHRIVTS